MPKIEIELQSDLCAASGEGFSNVIDTDVSYDALGIPFIPSRRLKGCLREAAFLINEKNIDKIFGVAGDNISGSLKFSSDARLVDYNAIAASIDSSSSHEDVLGLFTYVRAATEIDECGSAKDGSLRFMRVVKKYSPIDRTKKIKFSVECEIEDDYKTDMERICKALRSIGYKRNRGFGSVRCTFDSCHNTFNTPSKLILDPETEYELPATITNTLPLILSQGNDDDTLDYISGTSILGAFAWMYHDKTASTFSEIFLEGGVTFSNFYSGQYPVPLCYAKMKQAETYVNLAKEEDTNKGDTPKTINRGYVDVDGKIIEPKKEIIYHHRHRFNNSSDDALLYMQTAISANHTFNGSIKGKGKYLNELVPIIDSGFIRVGKSRTAQYGHCCIKIEKEKKIKEEFFDLLGEDIVVVLQSDILLLNNGIYSWDEKFLLEEIEMKAGIVFGGNGMVGISTYDRKVSSIAYKIITGYNGVWNLKKPQAKAFKAGSVMIYRNVSGKVKQTIFIGARQNEGYGVCRIMRLSEMPELYKESNLILKEQNSEPSPQFEQLLKDKDRAMQVQEAAIKFAKENIEMLSSISISQLDRVRRMAEDADDENDLNNRIGSIRSVSVKNAFIDLIKIADKEYKDNKFSSARYDDYKCYIDTILRYQTYYNKISNSKNQSKSNKGESE